MKKIKLFIALIFLFHSLHGQQIESVGIHINQNYGLLSDDIAIQFTSMAFSKDIGQDVHIFLAYRSGHGGKALGNIFSESQMTTLLDGNLIDSRSQINSTLTGEYFQLKSISLGIKKSVLVGPKQSLSLSVAGHRYSISESQLNNIEFDSAGNLLIDNLQESYSRYGKWSTEIRLSLYHNFKEYVGLFVSGGYNTIPSIISFGLGLFTSF